MSAAVATSPVLPGISPGKGRSPGSHAKFPGGAAATRGNNIRSGKAPAIIPTVKSASSSPSKDGGSDADPPVYNDGEKADVDGAHADKPAAESSGGDGDGDDATTSSPPQVLNEVDASESAKDSNSSSSSSSSSSDPKKGKPDAKSPANAAKARRLKMAKAKEARRTKAAAKKKAEESGGGGGSGGPDDPGDGAKKRDGRSADAENDDDATATPHAPAATATAADVVATVPSKQGVEKKKKASLKVGGAKKRNPIGSKQSIKKGGGGGGVSRRPDKGGSSKGGSVNSGGSGDGGGGGGGVEANDRIPPPILTDADSAHAEGDAESSASATLASADSASPSTGTAAGSAGGPADVEVSGGVSTIQRQQSTKKKVKEMMQLSPPQLERITKAFQKYDRDRNGDVNKAGFTLIMEELGEKPEKVEDLDKLWKSKAKFQKHSKRSLQQKNEFLTMDEYIRLMAAMIGVMATPGVLLHVLALDFKTSAQEEARIAKEIAARLQARQAAKDSRGKRASLKQKGGKRKKGSEVDDAAAKPKKVEVKKSPPQLTLRIAGFLNAKESVKARKQKGNEAMRNVKNKVIYHSEMFLECPVSCSEPMIIEAVRSRKTVGRDGKMTRDIVGCALLDITKLSDDEETMNIQLFKPYKEPLPEDHVPRSVSRRGSDMSGGSGSHGNANSPSRRGSDMSDHGAGAGTGPEDVSLDRKSRASLKVPSGVGVGRRAGSTMSDKSTASGGSSDSKSAKSTKSSGSKGSGGDGGGSSKRKSSKEATGVDTELLGVKVGAVAGEAPPVGKGERSTSQISLAADGIELTDEVIGTLHITIRRHLHVAKEKATDEYNEDGELNEARPLSGQDASSIPYDQVERGLKRMIAKAVTDPKTNESNNPLIEEMWATIDFQGMGLISVAAMDKFINKKFHVLKNSETLLYAYKLVSNSNRSVNLSGVTADRRSWVAYHDFMKLLCHQFYFKRFWAVYERYLYVGEGGAYVSSPDISIDMKDFSFILKRSGVRLGDHDASTLFEACQVDDSTGKVPLAAACHVTTMRVFFPMSSEAKAASQPGAAVYAATAAAKMKKLKDGKGGKGARSQANGAGTRSAAASGGRKGGRQAPGRGGKRGGQ